MIKRIDNKHSVTEDGTIIKTSCPLIIEWNFPFRLIQ